MNDPRLKDVMQRAGVTSAPHITFLNVVRANAAGQNVTDYVEIIHKVADFDKWLKVYDAEGSATRAAEGMVDGILARSIDDPSMVYLVFDITDPAKAKAALASEAKKKLMMGAGVISKPEILFFRSVVAH
ncbi:MAG: hypothetical protein LH606_02825 [Cytophagaceae bacterium]|nr:hypothetical protein [Cytophagaceae bacterium]